MKKGHFYKNSHRYQGVYGPDSSSFPTGSGDYWEGLAIMPVLPQS